MLKWTKQEDVILKKYYPIDGLKTCKNLLSRSTRVIQHLAYNLGLFGMVRGKRQDWTSKEDKIIRSCYLDGVSKVCSLLKNRTRSAITSRAHSLGFRIKKVYKWDDEDDRKLAEMYPTATIEELDKVFPDVKRHAIHEYARKRNIKCIVNNQRQGTLQPLLEESLEAYYWAGFIAADGHISKTGQLVVQLDKLDRQHLEKLARFLKTEVTEPYKNNKGKTPKYKKNAVRITVADKILGIQFAKKFDFSNRKTYNPPKSMVIKNWTKEQAAVFLAGVIDGDGCARSYNSFSIEIHGSWLSFFKSLLRKNGVKSYVKLNKRGYAHSYISFSEGKDLFSFVLNFGVPLLDRKWSSIRERIQK